MGLAKILAERLVHLQAQSPAGPDQAAVAFARLARELSFGIVNRLAAVRMAEKRRLLPEVLARGLESEAFKDVYQQAARSSFPTTHTAYVQFLRCVFDELATDLGMVMASRAPNAILFPGEHCLAELLAAMNHGDLDALWADDEAIGWIYQYYNDPEERKLLKKIQQSLARIDSGDYGWCEETGDAIGVPRLLARPTATLSLEAQQRRELRQKLYGD
jgi:hypothetical protein